ncbi:serine/threonine protein kinase with TPR repeats [Plesiocystis pacifica SIR-1]|uniref:Serine/threonine protein kinase with TPR repeats n=1 Tax=Plesiocystis pacifica SIR-1 TaxID=391625 RepID=A6GBF4_9BACT|nr:hypothetical protein [Plesiocystis pacifica]EDM76758.1 serine/threonine protein kinase with TPR repeats [Plesiocystis pacifica SIR-1]
MAELPCPACASAIPLADDAEDDGTPRNRCPSCGASLLIAYRYRLRRHVGAFAGGELYEGYDDGFAKSVAVLFVAREHLEHPDRLRRFREGNRMFADVGGRGLNRIHEIAGGHEPRPYVVMDWLEATLETRLSQTGRLEGQALVELFSTLLGGLARAHRAMPSVIHGHIHPGKIGFVNDRTPVLFGFEWATQVFEQDSRLADSFIRDAQDKPEADSTRAKDLIQLASAVYYAATGQWAGNQSVSAQQAAARQNVPGAVGQCIERMLLSGSGTGYTSAVDARQDLDRLLTGDTGWRARARPKQQSMDGNMGWSKSSFGGEYYTEEDGPSELFSSDLENNGDDSSVGFFETNPPPEAIAASPALFANQGGHQSVGAGSDWSGDQGQVATAFDRDREIQRLLAASPSSAPSPTPNFDLGDDGEPETSSGGRVVIAGAVLLIGFGVISAIMDASEEESYDSYEIPAEIDIDPIPGFDPNSVIDDPVGAPGLDGNPFNAEGVGDGNPFNAEGAAPAPSLGKLAEMHRWSGHVVGPVDGLSGAELGDSCMFWASPTSPGSSFNCRVYLECNDTFLYGGGTVGYTTCTLDENGVPVFAEDAEDDDGDGALTFDRRQGNSIVRVRDSYGRPPVLLSVALGLGDGKTEATIPDHPVLSRSTQPDAFGAAAEELPERPSTADLLAALKGSRARLSQCMVEPGTRLELGLTIANGGYATKVDIEPEQSRRATRCITSAIDDVEFPRFTDDEMTVTWPVSW